MSTIKTKKSIYLLIALAVLCFSLALYPFVSKSGYADEGDTETLSQSLIITQITVEQENLEEQKWTTTFELRIPEQSFIALTENGQKAVRLGALIGPESRLDDVSDFDTAKAQDFIALSPVGSQNSPAPTKVEFNNGEYKFTLSIIYDTSKISASKRILASSTDLVAIPFVAKGNEICVVMDNKAIASPRLMLADKYVREQDETEKTISQTIADNFAGTFTELEGEYYVCRSTSRLMSTPDERGDLEANNILNNDYEKLVLNGEILDIGTKTASLPSEVVSELPVNGSCTITIFKQDGTIASAVAPVAERVITRFFKQDSHSELNDWLADVPTETGATKKGVFYMGKPTSTNIPSIDGLYVLGCDIIPNLKSRSFNTSDDWGSPYVRYNPGYPNVAYYTGYGFVGTFDGRGKIIDFDYSFTGCYAYKGGLFNTLNGATVKNLAVLNVHPSGAARGAICYSAIETRFENCYFTVDSVGEFVRCHNAPIIMEAEDCHFENVIVESDINDFEYFQEDVVGGYGTDQGCGFSSSTLFAWRARNTSSQTDYDAFCGNTANNLVAVGNSPLYQVLYDRNDMPTAYEDPFGTDKSNGVNNELRKYFDPEKHFVATRIVNGPMQYYDGELKDCIMTEYSNYKMNRVFYPISAFEETDSYDRILEMAEQIKYAMKNRMSKEFIEELEGEYELKIGFMYKDGFYDMLSWDESNLFYVDNQEKLQNFITNGNGCWYVNEGTGEIVWDTLNYM